MLMRLDYRILKTRHTILENKSQTINAGVTLDRTPRRCQLFQIR